jgi:ankyrin repeat protein
MGTRYLDPMESNMSFPSRTDEAVTTLRVSERSTVGEAKGVDKTYRSALRRRDSPAPDLVEARSIESILNTHEISSHETPSSDIGPGTDSEFLISGSTLLEILGPIWDSNPLQQRSITDLPALQTPSPPLDTSIDWLSSHKCFHSWTDRLSTNELLLLRGATTLDRRSLFELLEKSFQNSSSNPLIISFTFERNSDNEDARFCSSLLLQLLRGLPDIQLLKMHATHLPNSKWITQEIWSLFRYLICAQSSRQIICVIDAVDQVTTPRSWFIQDLARVANSSESRFKTLVIIDGQYDATAETGVSFYQIDFDQSVSNDSGENGFDLNTFLSQIARSQSLVSFKEEILRNFNIQTTEQLRGAHMLVHYMENLGLRWLANSTISGTRPAEVAKTILSAIPFKDQVRSHQVLMWVSSSCCRLNLDELLAALNFTPSLITRRQTSSVEWLQWLQDSPQTSPRINRYGSQDGTNFPRSSQGSLSPGEEEEYQDERHLNVHLNSKEQNPIERLEDINKTLMLLLKIKNGYVELADPSIKDLLMTTEPWQWYYIDDTVQWEMCRLCLSYITEDRLSQAVKHLSRDVRNRGVPLPFDQQFAFLEYSVKYWPEHYQNSVKCRSNTDLIPVADNDQVILDFFEDSTTAEMWNNLYWHLKKPYEKSHHMLLISSPLLFCSALGFLNLVKKLIPDSEASSKVSEREIISALELASQFGNYAVVKYLIQNTKLSSDTFESAILNAAESGHFDVAMLLLRCVHTGSHIRQSHRLLCLSAEHGKIEVVQYLLETLNVDYHSSNPRSLTPAHHACSQGHVRILELLGKDQVSRADSQYVQFSLSQFAASKGHNEVVKKLHDFGVSTGSRMSNQPTPLHLAAANGYHQTVESLLRFGVSINEQDEENRTPLHISCVRGFAKIAGMLIENGAKLEIQDKDNNTPLHHAAERGHTPLLKLLLDKGADVSKQNVTGDTPLDIALCGGHEDASILLAEKLRRPTSRATSPGFDVSKLSKDHPLITALNQDFASVAETILKVSKKAPSVVPHGVRITSLSKAAEKGYVEVVKFLLADVVSQRTKIKRPQLLTSGTSYRERRTSLEPRDLRDLLTVLDPRNPLNGRRELREIDSSYLRERIMSPEGPEIPVHRERIRQNIEPLERLEREREFLIIRPDRRERERTSYPDPRITERRPDRRHRHSDVPPSRSNPDLDYGSTRDERRRHHFFEPPLERYDRTERSGRSYSEVSERYESITVPLSPRRRRHVRFYSNDSSSDSSSESGSISISLRHSSRRNIRASQDDDLTIIRKVRMRVRSPPLDIPVPNHASPESDNDAEDFKIPIGAITAALKQSSANGYTAVVKEIFKARPEILEEPDWFPTLLDVAVTNGHTGVAKELVAHLDVSAKEAYGEQLGEALLTAAKYGHVGIVQILLNSGVDINAKDFQNNTALQLAAYFKQPQVVRLLLLRRADTNLQDSNGSTALSDAVVTNSKDALELLLEAGASTEIRDELGNTALKRAVNKGRRAIVELLLQFGADVEAADASGLTPILQAALLRNIETDKLVLRVGSQQRTSKSRVGNISGDKHAKLWDEALLDAINLGDDEAEVVTLLINNGSNVNAVAPEPPNHTPLHKAAVSNHKKVTQILMHCGAEKNALSTYGTALQTAAFFGADPTMISMLLENKVEVNKTGGVYYTALQGAVAAMDIFGSEKVKMLLDHGALTYLNGGKYGTALHAAATTYSTSIAMQLIDHDNSVNLRTIADAMGRIPLHIAAQRNATGIFKAVKLTASYEGYEISDMQQRTALHFAAAGGAEWATKEIKNTLQMEQRRIYDVEDIDGWTPLHWALRQKDIEVVKLLIEKPSDLDRQSARGWTPRHVAYFHGNKYMINYLLTMFGETVQKFPEQSTEEISHDIVSDNVELTMDLRIALPEAPMDGNSVIDFQVKEKNPKGNNKIKGIAPPHHSIEGSYISPDNVGGEDEKLTKVSEILPSEIYLYKNIDTRRRSITVDNEMGATEAVVPNFERPAAQVSELEIHSPTQSIISEKEVVRDAETTTSEESYKVLVEGTDAMLGREHRNLVSEGIETTSKTDDGIPEEENADRELPVVNKREISVGEEPCEVSVEVAEQSKQNGISFLKGAETIPSKMEEKLAVVKCGGSSSGETFVYLPLIEGRCHVNYECDSCSCVSFSP